MPPARARLPFRGVGDLDMVSAVASRLRAPRRVARPTIPERRGAAFDHSRYARALSAAAPDGWRVDYGNGVALVRPRRLPARPGGGRPLVARPRRAARVLDQRLQRVGPRPGRGAHARAQRPRDRRRVHEGPLQGGAVGADRRRDRARDRAPVRGRPRPLRAEPRLGGLSPAARLRGPGLGGRLEENGPLPRRRAAGRPRRGERVLLSRIFQWFAGDFAPVGAMPSALGMLLGALRPARVLPAVRGLLPEGLREARRVGFLDYDWAVNGG